MTIDPLPGNPTALASRASDLSVSATAIQEAAEALFALSFAGSSQAIAAIAENADELANELRDVHGRYSGTASALATYAIDLQAAHNLANDAISDASTGASKADATIDAMNDLRRERDLIEASDPTSLKLAEIDRDLRDLAVRRDSYETAQHDAQLQHARALQDLNAAAQEAISRIDAALSDTNDGFWDHVGDFFANIGDALAAIAEWIGTALRAIVTIVLVAIAVVIALVIVAVLLLAVLLWIALVLPLLAVIGGLLLLSFLIPGLESWRTILLATLIGVALPLVGGLLLWRIGTDIFAKDPVVSVLDRDDIESLESRKAFDDANETPGLYSLKDYLAAEGLTDAMGRDDRSVVDIRKVIGPDGEERWVVTLPSTQDWLVPNGEAGATNDLDSNLALMLTPEMRTQYERAVLDAMAQAGIGPNDPVMLVGFSQGGIMAGHLAANRSDAYNFEAVLAYGAPIDAMNIPQSTRVLSIQHTGDVVPMLDLTDPRPKTDNHVTVQVDANDGTIGVSSHNNDKYRETAAYSPELQPYQDYFEEFSGTVVDQTQYTWQE